MSWAIWVTGPPGSGKTTLARGAAAALRAAGVPVRVLELDEVRAVVTPRPSYSADEREVVYRALVYMAKLLTEAGVPVLVDATAHRRAWRELGRRLIPGFAEVQLHCPVEVCRARERARPRGHAPPGIYARAGQPGASVPGVDVPYEPSADAELVLDTRAAPPEDGIASIVALARQLACRAPAADRARKEAPVQVKDWMTPSPTTVPPTMPVFEARRLMHDRRIRHLLVAQQEQLIGIVTDRDLRLNLPSPATGLSVWEINYVLMKLTVGEVMTRDLLTVGAGRSIETAAQLMLEHRIGALPVLDEGKLVGILTETDLLRALVSALTLESLRRPEAAVAPPDPTPAS